jgi:hypothetical protein
MRYLTREDHYLILHSTAALHYVPFRVTVSVGRCAGSIAACAVTFTLKS